MTDGMGYVGKEAAAMVKGTGAGQGSQQAGRPSGMTNKGGAGGQQVRMIIVDRGSTPNTRQDD